MSSKTFLRLSLDQTDFNLELHRATLTFQQGIPFGILRPRKLDTTPFWIQVSFYVW